MKRLGTGADIPEKVLRVTTTVDSFSNLDFMCDIGPGPVVRPPRLSIEIEFLFMVNNQRSHAFILNMNGYARNHEYDERLRDQLKQSHYWEREMWSSSHPAAFERDGWTLQIVDPYGVLEWFGLDAAADLFTQQNQINDKPVRLPAPAIQRPARAIDGRRSSVD